MRFWKYRDRDEVVGADGVTRPVATPTDTVVHTTTVTGPTQAELRAAADAAYDKGRRDERASRRSHPIIAIVVVILAIIGAAFLYFSAKNRSFSGGGQAVGQVAADAKAQAPGVINQAGQTVNQAAHDVSAQVNNATDRPADSSLPASQ